MTHTRHLAWILLIAVWAPVSSWAQRQPEATELAATVMRLWPMPQPPGAQVPEWSYDQGVFLQGMLDLWHETGDRRYVAYTKAFMDAEVDAQGNIQGYQTDRYRLDDIPSGRVLLDLYRVTQEPRYLQAARQLYIQLKHQPRTPQGGFWHKKIYPDQMWLDGLYMAEPFYAAFARLTGDTAAFQDIALQFNLVQRHLRDSRTGLYYHGWDASGREAWADPVTGHSPCIWGRANGWLAMALVDVLDELPPQDSAYQVLLPMFRSFAAAICRYQDSRSGCWYQVMDQGARSGNYLEASCSSMFVYALARGVAHGYLPKQDLTVARKGYQGILHQFVRKDAQGHAYLTGTCRVAGLGGHPYRDGSYAYYLAEPVDTNDPKGLGAFLLASHQMDVVAWDKPAPGMVVTLDHYYNHEYRKTPYRPKEPFHYVWTDEANSGFSTWGRLFRYHGAQIRELPQAPSRLNLPARSIYLIVDPDTKAETAHPHVIEAPQVAFLVHWVRQGGILVLMANDSANCEFQHLNMLASRFGIRFKGDSRNHVTGRAFQQGSISLSSGQPIWQHLHTGYIKDLSSLELKPPAQILLQKKDYVVAALACFGKGWVLAVGDPWLYNEYTDGRKLPASFQNFQAADQLCLWLLNQAAAHPRTTHVTASYTTKQQ